MKDAKKTMPKETFPNGMPEEGSVTLANGIIVKWMHNAGGGRTYFSDENGPSASAVDTSLTSVETLSAILAIELALQKQMVTAVLDGRWQPES